MTSVLLALWACATFGVAYFARDLQWQVAGWPVGFWVGAQGGLVLYVAINWYHARFMDRLDARYGRPDEG